MPMVNSQLKKRALHRAKILRGQIEALIKAIEQDKYCPDIMHQSLSIQQSLKSLDRLMLENHLKEHVRKQMQDKNQEERAIKELLNLYTLSTK